MHFESQLGQGKSKHFKYNKRQVKQLKIIQSFRIKMSKILDFVPDIVRVAAIKGGGMSLHLVFRFLISYLSH